MVKKKQGNMQVWVSDSYLLGFPGCHAVLSVSDASLETYAPAWAWHARRLTSIFNIFCRRHELRQLR